MDISSDYDPFFFLRLLVLLHPQGFKTKGPPIPYIQGPLSAWTFDVPFYSQTHSSKPKRAAPMQGRNSFCRPVRPLVFVIGSPPP